MSVSRPVGLLSAESNAVPRRGARSLGRALEFVALVAIFLAALLLRTYALDAVPAGLHGDEGIAGLEGKRILREGNIGPYSPETLGMPSGPLYLIALGIRVFGDTVVGVRIVPALLGSLTVLGTVDDSSVMAPPAARVTPPLDRGRSQVSVRVGSFAESALPELTPVQKPSPPHESISAYLYSEAPCARRTWGQGISRLPRRRRRPPNRRDG